MRKMRIVRVECDSTKERAAIQLALSRPDVRAFCAIVGYLDPLPSDRARARVLNFVADGVAEKASADAESVAR